MPFAFDIEHAYNLCKDEIENWTQWNTVFVDFFTSLITYFVDISPYSSMDEFIKTVEPRVRSTVERSSLILNLWQAITSKISSRMNRS
jgi:hypothetical protein